MREVPLLLLLLLFSAFLLILSTELYDLPVLSEKVVDLTRRQIDKRFENGKFIPQLAWIAIRSANDSRPVHTAAYLARNPDWKTTYCDNEEKDRFMREYFSNTSFLWAYDAINPVIGTAKAELWRLAVLYVHGGMYMDDDADVLTPLTQIVRPSDKFLVGKESYNWTDMCYRDEYALSNASLNLRYGVKANARELFDNRFFLNWILFSSPGNPLLLRVMTHVVQLIKFEYLTASMIKMDPKDHRGKLLMCMSTFPITLAAREMLLEGRDADVGIRVISEQFAEYQGVMKAWNNDHNPNRWVKQMNKKRLPYLHSYAAPSISLLEGRCVQFHNQRDIFLVRNGTRHSFPDFQTFVDMGFGLDLVQLVAAKYAGLFPVGDPLPTTMKQS